MPSSKPHALSKGDLIRIVSPASPIKLEKMERAISLLEGEGYAVDLATHALDADYYLAGGDAERAADLEGAFSDPKVRAVLCSRGGYGAARILPRLDLAGMAASRKLFLGYSDVTTLHLALNRRGLPTVYAPMPITLSVDREPFVMESFLGVLRGETKVPASAPRGETLVPGVAEGLLTGGCLCLLTDSLGTAEALDARGKLLIIEDVDENPHRLDAMFTHLLNASVLQSAAGIVIGEMTNTDERCDPTIGSKPWREIVVERVGSLGIPSVIGYPFGHMKGMLSLPLHITARLDAEEGTLTYTEALCD